MKPIRKIGSVLILALCFRFLIVFCLPLKTFENTIKRYHYSAVNLIEGHGYSHAIEPPYEPSFYKPPVYAFFLAGIYSVFGVHLNGVRIVQIFLDVLGCVILFLLLGQYFNPQVAFCGGMMMAFCPFTAVYTNSVSPETLIIFLLLTTLWLVSKAQITNRPIFFLCAGLSSMLMSYCRQELFPLVFIFCGYLIVSQLKRHAGIRKVLLFVVGVIVIMTPWVIRNYVLTGRAIILSDGSGLGFVLFHSTIEDKLGDNASGEKYLDENPDIERKYRQWYVTVLKSDSNYEDKMQVDQYFLNLAIENIRKDPIGFVLMRLSRAPRVWLNIHPNEFAFLNTQRLRMFHPEFKKIYDAMKNDMREVIILFSKYILFLINICYVILALVGIWQIRKSVVLFSFVVLPLVYAQVFFFFFHIAEYYTIPYWACILFFSSIGCYCCLSTVRRDQEGVNGSVYDRFTEPRKMVV